MEDEHLVGGRPAGEAEALGQVPLRAAGLTRAGGMARDLGASLAGSDQAAGDLRERALLGPVRPQEPDELGLADLEVDPVQRRMGAVALDEPADPERFTHRTRSLNFRIGFSKR